jgi:hypothetical protein
MNNSQANSKRIILVRFPRATLSLFAGCLMAVAGCERDRREEEIVVEEVTYPDRQKIRLRAASIKRGDVIWFFRILGPNDEVAKHVDGFNALVRSAKFADKNAVEKDKAEPVTLTPPKDWHKDPPSPAGSMRFAGYRIAAEPKEIEVSVTWLKASEDWLRSNVVRWQKMVNEPPVQTVGELETKVTREGGLNGDEIVWVDLTGLGVHTVSKPPDPMAAANPKKFQFPLPGQKQPRGANSPFTYDVPENWKKGAVINAFMVDRYLIGEDVQVSLTNVGGSLAMNMNRWRKEVGLPPDLDDAQAAKQAEVTMVAGQKAYYVDISNPAGPPDKNRSLAVMIPMGETNWFIKMWGPKDSVEKNKNAFGTFVKSFKLDAR